MVGNDYIERHRIRLFTILLLSFLTACTSRNHMSADEFIERLKKADFQITAPAMFDTGALENNHYIKQYRTVMANSILVSVMEFEDESMAATYRIKFDQLPDPYAKLPPRMRSALGNTRIIQHKNLVIRLVENLSGQKNSAEADRIIELINQL